MSQEERKRRREQPEEQDLPPEKGLEVVCGTVLPHVQSCRQTAARR